MAKNTGKAPSIQFYPKDWMFDMDAHPLEIEGAWIRICCKLWHGCKAGKLTRTAEQWARILGVVQEKARVIFAYLQANEIAEVTYSNDKITIGSRRVMRDAKLREANRLRQERHKERQRGNGKVTPEKPNPSSSTSSSTSSSINTYTLQEVVSCATLIGFTEKQAERYYHHYNSQGWVKANGQPITDLRSALVEWRNNEYKFKGKKNERNTDNSTQRSKAGRNTAFEFDGRGEEGEVISA